MSVMDVVEKVLTVLVSSAVTGALGYVIASVKSKKALDEFRLNYQNEISAKVTSAKEEIRRNDLHFLREALSKNLQDAKGELSRVTLKQGAEIEALEREVDKLKETAATEAELRSFTEEQVDRWNEVQRSLGFIEGQLKTRRRT